MRACACVCVRACVEESRARTHGAQRNTAAACHFLRELKQEERKRVKDWMTQNTHSSCRLLEEEEAKPA